jgi:NarL family two-component system response regulator LiaR
MNMSFAELRAERGQALQSCWNLGRSMHTARVFVVDDHPMLRRGVADMLATEPEFVFVGEAGDGAQAVQAAPSLAPDVVLVDLDMPVMDGIAAIQALRPLLPRAQFVVLACALDAAQACRALAAGAVSFVLKSASQHELVTVLRAARTGQRVLSEEVAAAVAAHERGASVGADLTHRERTLLRLMAQGLSNREIAEQLAIAMPTVKFHVTNILAKLHADNRTTAVLAALRHDLVGLQ